MDEAQSVIDNSSLVRCAHKAQVDPRMLRPHPANPNVHPEDQIDLFVKILRYQGWRRPITISTRSNFITKGHGAREAALAIGCSIVPVDYQDYENESQEIADIIADNQLARMSQMSTVKLQDLIVSLDTGAFNLELTGLKMDKIETLMTTVPSWSGHAERQEPAVSDLSLPSYATETLPTGGPAEGDPYQVEMAEAPVNPADNPYTKKIKSPVYEPRSEKSPEISTLFNVEKMTRLVEDIETDPDLSDEERAFLKLAAYRHVVFSYENIAEFYSHARKNVQTLMEDSALVIIDFNKAIEKGFVDLADELAEAYLDDEG